MNERTEIAKKLPDVATEAYFYLDIHDGGIALPPNQKKLNFLKLLSRRFQPRRRQVHLAQRWSHLHACETTNKQRRQPHKDVPDTAGMRSLQKKNRILPFSQMSETHRLRLVVSRGFIFKTAATRSREAKATNKMSAVVYKVKDES